MFWIDVSKAHCYLFDQHQWRRELSFGDVLN
jgi:hypothetical protein